MQEQHFDAVAGELVDVLGQFRRVHLAPSRHQLGDGARRRRESFGVVTLHAGHPVDTRRWRAGQEQTVAAAARGLVGDNGRDAHVEKGIRVCLVVFATIDNQAYANAFLYMGVTAIVANEASSSRRDGLFLTGTPSPRVYRMASVQGYDPKGLSPAPRTITELMTRGRKMDPAELTKHVDELASDGVKVLLLHYSLLPDQLRVVAAHARHLGLATIGELGATTYPEAISAGVRAFVHTSRYSLELAPPDIRAKVAALPFGPPRIPYYEYLTGLKDDDPALARYAATLAASGVMLIPTLSLSYLDLPGHRNPWTEPAARLLDPADLNQPADPKSGERPVSADPRDAFPPGFGEQVQLLEARYCKAGARYLAGSGTDALGTMPGISLHTELELLVKACLTPRQALAAATANVGTAFAWRDVGQIRAGYNADLLVLDADPTADIANVTRIDRVMVAGAHV